MQVQLRLGYDCWILLSFNIYKCKYHHLCISHSFCLQHVDIDSNQASIFALASSAVYLFAFMVLIWGLWFSNVSHIKESSTAYCQLARAAGAMSTSAEVDVNIQQPSSAKQVHLYLHPPTSPSPVCRHFILHLHPPMAWNFFTTAF